VSAPATERPGAGEAAAVAPPAPPPPAPRLARVLRSAERLFLVAGLVLLVVLVRELGAGTVLDNLRLVGWGIVPVVAQEILAYGANTLGWRWAFPPPRPHIPFARLFGARLAGDAINYVTPTATIGGEFVRTRLLNGLVPTMSVVASVAVAKLAQTLAQIGFVIVGLVIVLEDTPLPAGVRHGLLAGLALFTLLTALLLLVQRRGMFAPLVRFVQRVGLQPRAPELLHRLEHLDAEIARFRISASRPLLMSVAAFFVGWTVGVLEIYLILWFLGVEVSVHRALTIEVMSVAIDGMLFFVPGKVGTQEGGKVLIFTALGLDPAKGLALGILRRIRELTWAGIGLLVMSRRQLAPTVAPPAP